MYHTKANVTNRGNWGAGEAGERVYGTLYFLLIFSVNLKLFQKIKSTLKKKPCLSKRKF